MDTARIRTVAVIGPHGAGKTTLIEALLYDMGAIPARGGPPALEDDPEAARRGMSLGVGVGWGTWRDTAIQLLDTPGHADLATDVRLALAAADAAIVVVGAARGVDAHVRKAWKAAKDAGLPAIVFVNAIDADGARDYGELVAAIRAELDPHAVPLELPIRRGAAFEGDVDLVAMRAQYFRPGTGELAREEAPPPELDALAARWHTELVEAVAELHDDLLVRYLEGEEPTAAELVADLHDDLEAGKLTPVLCGSAARNVAIRPLLDAIVDLLPAPAARTYPALTDLATGEAVPLAPHPGQPLVAAVFKTVADPYMGKISVFRVFRGTVDGDSHVAVAGRGGSERVGRLYKLVGRKATPVERLGPGEIGAIAKLKEARTGDTLVAGAPRPRPLAYPMPAAGPAIWSVAIAPAVRADETKLAAALARLKEEDPGLAVAIEPRTHRIVLGAQGPTHLDLALARLRDRHHLAITTSEPEIPYRETVRRAASGQGRHKKQTGGRGQFGDVWLRIEPLPRGAGFEFVDAVVGGAVPRAYVPAVEKGVREALEEGPLAGFPIADVRITLYDGSSHAVDSSEMAFKAAAHLALRRIFDAAGPVLLEPMMEAAIEVPPEAVGDALAELNARRAHVEGVAGATITAAVPLAELAALRTAIQARSRGEGRVDASFRGYVEVPEALQGRLLATLRPPHAA
jgi:elongation factor G